MCDTCQTGGVGNSAQYRTVQEFLGIEDIVDFLVLKQSVCMDAGSGYIKVTPDEGGARGNFIAKLYFIQFCDFRNHGRVHAI